MQSVWVLYRFRPRLAHPKPIFFSRPRKDFEGAVPIVWRFF